MAKPVMRTSYPHAVLSAQFVPDSSGVLALTTIQGNGCNLLFTPDCVQAPACLASEKFSEPMLDFSLAQSSTSYRLFTLSNSQKLSLVELYSAINPGSPPGGMYTSTAPPRPNQRSPFFGSIGTLPGGRLESVQLSHLVEELHSSTMFREEIKNIRMDTSFTVEKVDDVQQTCLVSFKVGPQKVKAHVTVPRSNSQGTAPLFVFAKDSGINRDNADRIIKAAQAVAVTIDKNACQCLLPCLQEIQRLLLKIDNMVQTGNALSPRLELLPVYCSQLPVTLPNIGESVPYPRTCGATFCASGLFVCFLKCCDGGGVQETASSSRSFKIGPGMHGTWTRRAGSFAGHTTSVVHVLDLSGCFLLDRDLAGRFSLSQEIKMLPDMYSAGPMALVRADIKTAWSILSTIVQSEAKVKSSKEKELLWHNAFHIKLIWHLVKHFGTCRDIQSAGFFSSLLAKKIRDLSLADSLKRGVAAGQISHTTSMELSSQVIHDISVTPDHGLRVFDMPLPTVDRSTSSVIVVIEKSAGTDRTVDAGSWLERTIRPIEWELLHYQQVYSDILSRWGLVYQKAEVSKLYPYIADQSSWDKCLTCMKRFRGTCPNCRCRRPGPRCCVCNLEVRGLTTVCRSCGHGGHSVHLRRWFATSDHCPSGCGCTCLRDDV